MYKNIRVICDSVILGTVAGIGLGVTGYLYSIGRGHFAEKRLIKWVDNHFIGPVEYEPYKNDRQYLNQRYDSPDKSITVIFNYNHLEFIDRKSNSIKRLFPDGNTSMFRMESNIPDATGTGTIVEVFEESLNRDGTPHTPAPLSPPRYRENIFF